MIFLLDGQSFFLPISRFWFEVWKLPWAKKTIAVGKTISLWGGWPLKLYESDEKNYKCRNHMVSYGRATRSRVICHFLAVKRNPSPKYIWIYQPLWDWSMWIADHISPWKKKAKWNYGLGELSHGHWSSLIVNQLELIDLTSSCLKELQERWRKIHDYLGICY